MKFKFNHPKPTEKDLTGPLYWKSLEDLSQTEDFKDWVNREFPQGASELEGVNRRSFLKVMAASFAFGGLGSTACRRPEHKILPYSKQPENLIPGVAQFFASSRPTAQDNIPILVETHESRPTKIEGNPSYRPYGGSNDSFTQASVLDLYDPDRAKKARFSGSSLSPEGLSNALEKFRKRLSVSRGKGFAVLADPSTSISRKRLQKKLKSLYPEMVWAEYDATASDSIQRSTKTYFGKSLRPLYHYEKAKRILSLDDNFLNCQAGDIYRNKGFAKGRSAKNQEDAKDMNRLYMIESDFTLTGGMADHRLRASSSQVPGLSALIAAQVFRLAGLSSDLVSAIEKQGSHLEVDPQWILQCVNDLMNHKGSAVVTAGAHLPEEVHLLVHAINSILEAKENHLVEYLQLPEQSFYDIKNLANEISDGTVKELLILGCNPVYNAPSDLNWKVLQSSLESVWHYSLYEDETAAESTYFIPADHYLETWSDGRTFDGTIVPVQPTIAPLYDTVSELTLLASLIDREEKDAYTIVYETFTTITGSVNVKNRFNQFLSQGILPNSQFRPFSKAVTVESIYQVFKDFDFFVKKLSVDSLEFRFKPSPASWDGRYNNNGWLQELPDSMTKLTWDNAICISPKLGKVLGIVPSKGVLQDTGQLVPKIQKFHIGKEIAPIAKLKVNGRFIKGPIHVQPGLADYTVILTMGYGRQRVGAVGTGTGYNTFPLIDSVNRFYATGGTIEILEETYKLANTQEHWSMEGRAIIREANRDDYLEHPNFVKKMGMESHSPPIYGAAKDESLQYKSTHQPRGNSAYETPQFRHEYGNKDIPQQWGMVIDLNTCTGCNACVVACQSENNIPIVGKDQVLRGREMHWNRLDRYYSSGDSTSGEIPEDPQVSFMGVSCMQCEMAPCESVCPVNATVHDRQGLNAMAYNRCVGTRYCANNCPYKVRRFNFFDWNKRRIGEFYKGPFGDIGMTDTLKMKNNPDVTVRMRGVMEKCTYCVQRIQAAKIRQKVRAKNSNNIKVPDGTIKVACQQVCPVDGVSFGDISDPKSQVSQAKESDRDYAVLGYLNVRPRTTYLARLRNPNPRMPDFRKQPLSRMEYDKKSGHGDHHSGDGHKDSHSTSNHRSNEQFNPSTFVPTGDWKHPKAPIPLNPKKLS